MSEKSVPIDELAKKVTAVGLGVANSLHAIGWFTLLNLIIVLLWYISLY